MHGYNYANRALSSVEALDLSVGGELLGGPATLLM